MNKSSPTNTAASSLMAGKITRKQLAAHFGLCVRTIDELARRGVLGHFKIGKSVRYDLAECEAALRKLFYVDADKAERDHAEGREETRGGGLRTSRPTACRATSRQACAGAGQGRAGCPQPAASEPMVAEVNSTLREKLDAQASTAECNHAEGREETRGGGLRTSRPTTAKATIAKAAASSTTQPAA